MKATLTDNTVAYNMWGRLSAVQSGAGKSCRGLNVQFPMATIEAANAGANVKIGQANAGATDVTQPEVVLSEGESYLWPTSNVNDISLVSKWLKGSAASVVVYINPEYA